jgi:thioesterase domain-containing protein
MQGATRLLAKTSYYWSRLRLHARTLWSMTHSERFGFLSERFRLCRASLSRRLASSLSTAGLSVSVRLEEQTTLVEQVIFSASRRYRAQPYPGTTLFFRSSEQPTGEFLAEDMGWGKLVGSSVEIATLPGDHRKIFDDPGAQILAEKIAGVFLPDAASARVAVRDRGMKSSVGNYSGPSSCAAFTR